MNLTGGITVSPESFHYQFMDGTCGGGGIMREHRENYYLIVTFPGNSPIVSAMKGCRIALHHSIAVSPRFA